MPWLGFAPDKIKAKIKAVPPVAVVRLDYVAEGPVTQTPTSFSSE